MSRTPIQPAPNRHAVRRTLTVASVVLLLGVGGIAAAQRGAFGPNARGLQSAIQSPLTVDFYDVDPATEGATPIASAEIEPPVAFVDLLDLDEADGATYAVIRGAIEHTVDLATLEATPALGLRMGAPNEAGPYAGMYGPQANRGTFGYGARPMGPNGFGYGPQGVPMRGGAMQAPRGQTFGRGFSGQQMNRGAMLDRARGLHERLHQRADAPLGQLRLALRGVNDGATVTLTLYDGDPSTGAQAIDTFSWVVGEDDAATVLDDVRSALVDGAWIDISIDGAPFEVPAVPATTDTQS